MERDAYDTIFPTVIKISTHTLTWSVTSTSQLVVAESDYFNSHAHVERDMLGLQAPERVFGISTHTLTWSVTCAKMTQ